MHYTTNSKVFKSSEISLRHFSRQSYIEVLPSDRCSHYYGDYYLHDTVVCAGCVSVKNDYAYE